MLMNSKTRLIDEWAQFDQSIVDAAISQTKTFLHSFFFGDTV